MGLLDNLKSRLGGRKESTIASETKAPSQILKENGVDPSGLRFAFSGDGTVTISGQVKQEADKARIKQLLLGIPGIKQVKQDLSLAADEAPGPAATGQAQAADPGTGEQLGAAKAEAGELAAGSSPATGPAKTYTVEAGDTLWKIARQLYGDGSKYLKIFEANKDLLKDPDQIFPGQELVIPDKD
jgi:nucleoid-associated protein YgaU